MTAVRRVLLRMSLLAAAMTIAAGLYTEAHRIPDQP
jgi:hypothetical protein